MEFTPLVVLNIVMQIVDRQISTHKGLTTLDGNLTIIGMLKGEFQPTRVSRPSTKSPFTIFSIAYISTHKGLMTLDLRGITADGKILVFQPTRVSRPSTFGDSHRYGFVIISTHKGLTTLDRSCNVHLIRFMYFNPQGSHDPRLARLTL